MKKSIKPETIKNNITKLLQNRNWTQGELEKRIDGNRNVSNIMRGVSKYPTIEVLQRIANAFNVEISQLISEHQSSASLEIDYDLLSESFDKVIETIKPVAQEHNLNPENILMIVAEVYHYCCKLNLEKVDEKFIDWVISKYYN